MRVKVFGEGPIYEGSLAVLRDAGCEIAGERPYDLIVLANVLRILKAPEIAGADLGVLCFHPSLLPRHRGADAVYWTFKMGDTETGVTWFWVDEGIDTGPVAIAESCPVPAGSSPSKLYFEQLVPMGVRLLATLIEQLKRGERPSVVQDERYATYEPRRPKKPA